eukprot:1943111-Pleurochrysis_carterae.AAC.3
MDPTRSGNTGCIPRFNDFTPILLSIANTSMVPSTFQSPSPCVSACVRAHVAHARVRACARALVLVCLHSAQEAPERATKLKTDTYILCPFSHALPGFHLPRPFSAPSLDLRREIAAELVCRLRVPQLERLGKGEHPPLLLLQIHLGRERQVLLERRVRRPRGLAQLLRHEIVHNRQQFGVPDPRVSECFCERRRQRLAVPRVDASAVLKPNVERLQVAKPHVALDGRRAPAAAEPEPARRYVPRRERRWPAQGRYVALASAPACRAGRRRPRARFLAEAVAEPNGGADQVVPCAVPLP